MNCLPYYRLDRHPVTHKSVFYSAFLNPKNIAHIYTYCSARSWLDYQYTLLISLLSIVACNLFPPSGIFFFLAKYILLLSTYFYFLFQPGPLGNTFLAFV